MNNMNQRLQQEFQAVIGRRLRSIHAMTLQEATGCGLEDWLGQNPIICLDFEGGRSLILSADPEGNGPGFALVAESQSA